MPSISENSLEASLKCSYFVLYRHFYGISHCRVLQPSPDIISTHLYDCLAQFQMPRCAVELSSAVLVMILLVSQSKYCKSIILLGLKSLLPWAVLH